MKRNIFDYKVDTNLRPIVNSKEQDRIGAAFDFWDYDGEDDHELDALCEHEYGRMDIEALRKDMELIYGEDTVARIRRQRSKLYRPQSGTDNRVFRRRCGHMMSKVAAVVVLCALLLSGWTALVIDQKEPFDDISTVEKLIATQPRPVVENVAVEQSDSLGEIVRVTHQAITSDIVSYWEPLTDRVGFFLVEITETNDTVFHAVNNLLEAESANAFKAIQDEFNQSDIDPQRMPIGDIVFGFLDKVGEKEYTASVAYVGAQYRSENCLVRPKMVSQSGRFISELVQVTHGVADQQDCAPISAGVDFIPNFLSGTAWAQPRDQANLQEAHFIESDERNGMRRQ